MAGDEGFEPPDDGVRGGYKTIKLLFLCVFLLFFKPREDLARFFATIFQWFPIKYTFTVKLRFKDGGKYNNIPFNGKKKVGYLKRYKNTLSTGHKPPFKKRSLTRSLTRPAVPRKSPAPSYSPLHSIFNAPNKARPDLLHTSDFAFSGSNETTS